MATRSADIEKAASRSSNEGPTPRRRNAGSPHHEARPPRLATRPFAGRIGGNQEFTVAPGSSEFELLTETVPDAAANFSWAQSFNLRAFADPDLWKEATIEGVGSCLQQYIAGLYSIGLHPVLTETAIGPVLPATYGAICNFLLISLFIFAAGPVSGMYLSPQTVL